MARKRIKRSKPMTMPEFLARFSTEEACAQFLFEQRWPNGWRCPECGREKAYHIAGRRLWECAACRRQTSVTAGTALHGTRTPLRLWFLAMFLMVSDKRGISSVALGQRLGIKQGTAWADLHKLRYAMAERESRYPLSGRIALGECFFGDPKEGGRRRSRASKTPVLVALSQTGAGGPAYLRTTALHRLDSGSVKTAVEAIINKGATIQTDRLRGYLSLTAWGYGHERIPAGEEGAAAIRGWIQIIISNARALIGGTYHGVSNKHLPSYLCEYEYRFNRRSCPDGIFVSIVAAAAQCTPRTYGQIVGNADATRMVA